jgi:Fe-S protein assembly co-chaperone HscB
MKKGNAGAVNLSMSDADPFVLEPFAALGMDPCFDLSLSDLEQAYLKTQQQIHPDKLKTSVLAQQAATRLSSQITQAYHSLKAPLSRAEALFWLRQAWPLPPAEACGTDLLEDMMEIQEQAGQQAQQPPEVKLVFKAHLEALTQGAYTDLSAVFEGTLDPEKASYAYHRFAYLQKLNERFVEND